MTEFHIDHLLTPGGWSDAVRLQVDGRGRIAALQPGQSPRPGATRLGTVVPGMANLHSHAFQRGMAGLSERRGETADSFWSWREVMYAFNDHLTPDHVETIAGLAYAEMLESGFTSVGEFHYLHHDRDGRPFTDPAEMAGRLAAAASATGIALTLLPVFYRHAGFGGQAPQHGQRRFLHDTDSFARLIEALPAHLEPLDHAVLGLAPHSLRAAALGDMAALLPLVENGPVHIHIAEQTGEVEACLAATGQRPVRYLLDHLEIDENWCLVHATHMDAQETRDLAASGAVAGLCPLTEASLGDGFFPIRDFVHQGGLFGIGSDSHIRIDLAEELRLLETGARLLQRQRNVLAPAGAHSGRYLFETALAGGAQALAQPAAGLSLGQRADLVELDTAHPVLAGRAGDTLLDAWIFCGDSRQVKSVHVGGREAVRGGRLLGRDAIERAYRATMDDLMRAVNP